ncbi:hypothetical protein Q8F55_003293 [Vanrija albida]|uniref:Retrotransposon gag domain-containing protein n=1 Tax=Vanrija albida TaxID=181172 RepID=A0ABR3Q4D7_9TREE
MPPKKASTSAPSNRRDTRSTRGGRGRRGQPSTFNNRASRTPVPGPDWPYPRPPLLPSPTPGVSPNQPKFLDGGAHAPREVGTAIAEWRTTIDEAFAGYNDLFVDLNFVRIPTTQTVDYARWKAAHHLLKTEIEDAEYLLKVFFTLDQRVQNGSPEELVSKRFREIVARSNEFFATYKDVIDWMPGLIDQVKAAAPPVDSVYHPVIPKSPVPGRGLPL